MGDYIPLYMIDFRDFSTVHYGYRTFPSSLPRSKKDFLNSLFSKTPDAPTRNGYINNNVVMPLFHHLIKKINSIKPADRRELGIFLDIYGNKMLEYANEVGYSYSECVNGVLKPQGRSSSDYYGLFHHQKVLDFHTHRLRSNTYVGGYGSLFYADGTPIWTMCVHKKYVEYVKLCFILGEEIDQSVYTLFVQEGFDTKNTTNKPLRSAYRKYMKKGIEANGIPIMEANFIELFTTEVKLPEGAMSISGKRAFEKRTFQDFVEYLYVAQELSDSGIELTA